MKKYCKYYIFQALFLDNLISLGVEGPLSFTRLLMLLFYARLKSCHDSYYLSAKVYLSTLFERLL